MLTQTDIDRERYEARRKRQLDLDTAFAEARLKGLAEGRAEGRAAAEAARNDLVETIQAFEELLQKPKSPTEQLAGLAFEDLRRLKQELQSQLRQQR